MDINTARDSAARIVSLAVSLEERNRSIGVGYVTSHTVTVVFDSYAVRTANGSRVSERNDVRTALSLIEHGYTYVPGRDQSPYSFTVPEIVSGLCQALTGANAGTFPNRVVVDVETKILHIVPRVCGRKTYPGSSAYCYFHRGHDSLPPSRLRHYNYTAVFSILQIAHAHMVNLATGLTAVAGTQEEANEAIRGYSVLPSGAPRIVTVSIRELAAHISEYEPSSPSSPSPSPYTQHHHMPHEPSLPVPPITAAAAAAAPPPPVVAAAAASATIQRSSPYSIASISESERARRRDAAVNIIASVIRDRCNRVIVEHFSTQPLSWKLETAGVEGEIFAIRSLLEVAGGGDRFEPFRVFAMIMEAQMKVRAGEMCIGCMTEPPVNAFLECGHVVYCDTCYSHMISVIEMPAACPLCRNRSGIVNIYTPVAGVIADISSSPLAELESPY